METLQDYRIKIQERLTQIASQRQNSPVFLLEHGLTVEEISAIRKLICSLRLGCDNLLRENYLILLVLLTETGYLYEGGGTNFWEKFAKTLNWQNVHYEQRNRIRELFHNLETVWHIAKPLPTKWALQFNIIAHPIANAVLPFDIRVPLIESLQVLFRSSSNNKQKIHAFLENYRPASFTIRYENWVKAFPFVDDLVSAFIFPYDITSFLSVDTFNRIKQDLENDKHLSATLREIRRKYSQIQKDITVPKNKPIYDGNLFLHKKNNGDYVLEGQLPKKVVEQLRGDENLKKQLRSGALQVLGWNSLRLKPACFLYQERFEIVPHYFEYINSPFVQNCGIGLLERVRFKFDCPALFQEGIRITKIETDTGTVICIVNEPVDEIDGVVTEYESDEFSFVAIDTSNPAALNWARGLGIPVIEKRHWHWICPCGNIKKAENKLSVEYGEPLYLFIETNYSVSINFRNVKTDNVTGFITFDNLSTGKHSIDIDDETWTLVVAGPNTAPHTPEKLLTAELLGEPITDSLRNKSLMLQIDSPMPFVNVDYSVSLSNQDGMRAEYNGKMESLPYDVSLFRDAFLGKDSEVKTQFWQLILSQQDLVLQLEISNVIKQRWTIEAVQHGIWWEQTEKPIVCSDGEELQTTEILHSKKRYPLYSDGFKLYQAAQNEKPVYRAATLLKSPDTFVLGNLLNVPQRKLRQLSDTANSVGLENIVEDILAFRQVQADSLIEEMQQRHILDELETLLGTITCGERWTETMNSIKEIDIEKSILLKLKNLIRTKLIWETTTTERCGISEKLLADAELLDLCSKAETKIRGIYDYWSTLEHDVQHYIEEQLSLIVFTILTPVLQERTGCDIIDGYIRREDWNTYFEEWAKASYGGELAAFIYPYNISRILFEELRNDWSLKGTAEYVTNIINKLKGHPYRSLWKPDIVRNVLAVFLNPSAFEEEWKQDTLRAMLCDQQVMRYIAFLYWRKRQSEKIREVFLDV